MGWIEVEVLHSIAKKIHEVYIPDAEDIRNEIVSLLISQRTEN